MGKSKTPSFVLTIEMKTNNSIVKSIEDHLEIARVIYNSCLGELLKRERQMKREKKYKKSEDVCVLFQKSFLILKRKKIKKM